MAAPGETKHKDNAEDIARVHKALEVLEKEESCLVKNYDAERNSARKHIRENNKSAARQCLWRKCCYERLLEKTGEYYLRLQDLMIMLDDSQTIRIGNTAIFTGQCYGRTMNTNSVEHQINEIIVVMEDMKQIKVAISDSVDATPVGTLTNPDEKDIEFELEMIEEEQRRLAAAATACPCNA